MAVQPRRRPAHHAEFRALMGDMEAPEAAPSAPAPDLMQEPFAAAFVAAGVAGGPAGAGPGGIACERTRGVEVVGEGTATRAAGRVANCTTSAAMPIRAHVPAITL
jgi:hypothetical protein